MICKGCKRKFDGPLWKNSMCRQCNHVYVRHEFEFKNDGKPSRCLHCDKLFVYCVNRDGTYNTKCVKRKET